MGALELRPIGVVAWARKIKPSRRRATYRRLKGTEQFLGFYDVHRDCLSGVCPTSSTPSAFFGPAPRASDSSSCSNCLDPTEASSLNLIETHFGVLKRFTLANTDEVDHIIRRRRIYRYLRYRHRKLGRLRDPLNRIRMTRPVKLEED